jgi:transcriptional regulator with XRE-family HTH domain
MQHQLLIDYLHEQKAGSGMTMAELSRRMGLSDGQLSNIVNGAVPGLKLCRQLAGYFNVSVEHVLYLAGHIEDPPGAYGDDIERIAHMVNRIGDEDTRRRAVSAATAVLEAFLLEDRAHG